MTRTYTCTIKDASQEYFTPRTPSSPNPDYFMGVSSEEAPEGVDGTVSLQFGWSTKAPVVMTPDQAEEIGKHLVSLADDARQVRKPGPGELTIDAMVDLAKAAARVAVKQHPAPNFTTLKIAEEAGEVIRGCVHYAEGRAGWGHVEGEIVQLLAMLIRLLEEGDSVNGVMPPRLKKPYGYYGDIPIHDRNLAKKVLRAMHAGVRDDDIMAMIEGAKS